MSRYIDADLAIKQIDETLAGISDKESIGYFALEQFRDMLKRVPTADVAEVRHGEWKEHYAYESWHYDCPFCGDGYATKEKDTTPPNFCSNCGAKMHGERRENEI